MTRRPGRTAVPALLTLAALLLLLTGGAVQAGPAALQVSLHASGPFGDSLPHSLFRGAGRLVPGDRVERTLYVRNGSDAATRPTVQVGFDPSNELSDALDFRVGIGGVAATARDESGRQTFTGPLALAPGEVQPIDVVMTLDRATGTPAMRQRTGVELLVTITETTGSVPTSVAAGEPGAVPGAAALPAVVTGLAALVGLAGAYLSLRAARRRRQVAARG
jgi:hypothetical protein